MYSRIVKSKNVQVYRDWIKANTYSILSSRHRGIYAEMIFKRFCHSKEIMAIKLNKYFDVLEQIPDYFLPKKQAKLVGKLGRIPMDFFCVEKGKVFFALVKMGTSNLSRKQREIIKKMGKIKVFLFHVFEDGDMFIKRLN